MKKRKIEIMLLVIAIMLTSINLIVHINQGISKAQVFNSSCSIIFILLWAFSIIKRKPKK